MKKIISALAAAAALAVAPAPSAAGASHGDPSDWTYIYGTDEASPRWDPCAPVTWSADDPALARAMSRAARMAAKFSGLSLVRVPSGGAIEAAWNDEWTEANHAVGITGPEFSWGPDGLLWMDRASLGFNTVLVSVGERNLQTTVMHELGHALGLGHAHDTVEVMGGNSTVRRYQAGDKAGLAAVQRASCRPQAPGAE